MVKTEERDIRLTLERLVRLLRAVEHNSELNPAQWEALRYISRANRFSNSPIALTRYLGATKGTISQTLSALVRKELITKTEREDDPRSLALALTKAGKKMLANDSWSRLDEELQGLSSKKSKRLSKMLDGLLQAELIRSNGRSFGECVKCRYFRGKGWTKPKEGPHMCLLYEAPITKEESRKICIDQEAI